MHWIVCARKDAGTAQPFWIGFKRSLWSTRVEERKMKMDRYVISCESTADLTKEHLLPRDIYYICYPYSLDGKVFPKL